MNRLVYSFLLFSFLCVSCTQAPDLGSQKISRDLTPSEIQHGDYLISDAPIGKYGDTLRLTHFGKDPKTLNPWIASDASSSYYGGLLFEGLFVHDPDTYEVIPHMAKDYEIQKGGKKIIVKMRENLKWTDGERIDADDVVFTWNDLIKDQVAVSSLRDILLVDGKFPKVKKLDEFKVSFETEKVFAPFLSYIGIAIAPKHDVESYFEKLGAKSFEEKQKAFNNYLSVDTKPKDLVSNGPFRLLRMKRGERIELARNQTYFVVNKEFKRLPYVDKVVYSYVQDHNADIFKFLAGESYTVDITPANVALMKTLEEQNDYTIYERGPSTGTSFIWFNLTKHVPEPKYSWFNSKNFRQAISYAIDRESIVNNVFQGLGSPLFTAESLQSPFVNQKLTKGHERDLDKARSLLKKDGFKINEKGDLIDSKDNKVEFNLLTNAGNQERELISTIIVDNLKDLGIKVNFKALEFNNFVARTMTGESYEAGLLGLTGGYEPNGGANVWRSDGRLHMFDPRPYLKKGAKKSKLGKSPIRDWEKDIDKLFTKGVQTLDIKKRKAIYNKFQEIVYEELPLIYIASPNMTSAANNKLGNVRNSKYGGLIPHIYEVYIKQ